MSKTPKRAKPFGDATNLPPVTPPRAERGGRDADAISPAPSLTPGPSPSSGEARRGRPRAELLTSLIMEGATSPSSIKCKFCSRVFPREKSLQAHLRTHTGERPYACDYPKCTRRFVQSGQLKTHQRLHTGEKPFMCIGPECERRFTHANRHCPEHPELQLKRFTASLPSSADKSLDDEHSTAIEKWLKNNKRSSEDPSKSPRKRTSRKYTDDDDVENVEAYASELGQTWSGNDSGISVASARESEDVCSTNSHDCLTQTPAVQQLFKEGAPVVQPKLEPDGDDVPKSGPECVELPKKRWLREAVQDQQRWDSSQELARPLNWGEMNLVEYENQRRPTVLMRVQDHGARKEVSRADIQTAIALVEMRNGRSLHYR